MRYYVISYDLRGEVTAEDYVRIAKMLNTAPECCKPLLSFWVVGTDLSPAAIVQILRTNAFIDTRDGIVVLEITGRGDFFGVEQHAEDWLLRHIRRA